MAKCGGIRSRDCAHEAIHCQAGLGGFLDELTRFCSIAQAHKMEERDSNTMCQVVRAELRSFTEQVANYFNENESKHKVVKPFDTVPCGSELTMASLISAYIRKSAQAGSGSPSLLA